MADFGPPEGDGPDTIRVAAPSGEPLARRIAHRLQRATWSTPLHAMRLKGRPPLKLLAVPADPLPGNAALGQALVGGIFRHGLEELPAAALDFAAPGRSAGFADHLRAFAFLRDLAAPGLPRRAAEVAEALVRRWLAAEGQTVGPGWRADLAGRRILAWTMHAPLILSSGDPVHRSAVLNALARQARHLERAADKAPPGLPRIAACAGLTAANLLLPGLEPRLARAVAALGRAIDGAVFDDGGIVSRAPVDLLALVLLLAEVRAAFVAVGREAPSEVAQALARAVPALLGVTMGDGALGSWQRGGPLPAAEVAAVVQASGVRARPLRRARDWGYQRMAAGPVVLVVDCAPPPAAARGAASTLAFELSDGTQRLVVNCGGASPRGRLADALAAALRTTAAHSTLTLADTNSTALGPDGLLGRGVIEVELDRREDEGGSTLEAAHDGYAQRFGLRHRRRLALAADGRTLLGEDALEPAGRRRRRAAGFAVRFHLAPAVEATPTADGQAVLLRLAGGAAWQFRAKGSAVAIEPSLWIDGEGRSRPTVQLVAAGEAAAEGALLTWSLRRVG